MSVERFGPLCNFYVYNTCKAATSDLSYTPISPPKSSLSLSTLSIHTKHRYPQQHLRKKQRKNKEESLGSLRPRRLENILLPLNLLPLNRIHFRILLPPPRILFQLCFLGLFLFGRLDGLRLCDLEKLFQDVGFGAVLHVDGDDMVGG